MKNRRSLFLLALTLVFSFLFLFFAVKFISSLADRRAAQASRYSEVSAVEDSRSWGSSVELNGKKYHLKDRMSTVLFLGVDYGKENAPEGNVGTGPRSDTMILFILDDTAKTIQAVMISRDTMTEVDLYKANGDYAFSGVMQITMQYTFGDSPRRACYLTKKAVSRLLYETRIDYCMSLALSGLSEIIDELGGLTITMPEDYTDIDSRYEQGAVVTLTGADAEKFIRVRDADEFGSNNVRMTRQFELVKELFAELSSKGGASYIEEVLEKADAYVESDLDGDTIQKFATYTFLPEPIYLPGEDVQGEFHDEFYVNDPELQQLLLSLLYEER
ncbi:MAG: LCP family protein [Firmicutes bacterium]|nr:LCP family protein [Bacillota bacterium]